MKEIVEKDTREMSIILEEMTRLKHTFNETQNIFSNLEDFVTKSNAPNVITGNILTVSILDSFSFLSIYRFGPVNSK